MSLTMHQCQQIIYLFVTIQSGKCMTLAVAFVGYDYWTVHVKVDEPNGN